MSFCIQCGHATQNLVPTGDSHLRDVCPSCHFVHYENPKVVCGALCTHQGKILLCRRAIEPRYGYWTLPAGFMEIGETMAQGALRETTEEAEATGENPQLYCLFDIPTIGQIHVMYRANLVDGHFGVGSESLECRLFSPDEIPWDDLSFPSVKRCLEWYIQDSPSGIFTLHSETLERRF